VIVYYVAKPPAETDEAEGAAVRVAAPQPTKPAGAMPRRVVRTAGEAGGKKLRDNPLR
jgi:hypothetical protein